METGIATGGFLLAALANDFVGAAIYADTINAGRLKDWAWWLTNEAPPECWGSEEKMKTWESHQGLSGKKETP